MTQQVLIVDDDPGVRFTVRKVLGPAAWNVFEADGGLACLEILRDGFRGVILMDVMMPGMDGWQTIQALMDEGLAEGNIICMLTAVHDSGTDMEPIQECVVDYIRKPFDADRLREQVTGYLCFLR